MYVSNKFITYVIYFLLFFFKFPTKTLHQLHNVVLIRFSCINNADKRSELFARNSGKTSSSSVLYDYDKYRFQCSNGYKITHFMIINLAYAPQTIVGHNKLLEYDNKSYLFKRYFSCIKRYSFMWVNTFDEK